jgi:hypothetical protein
MTRGRARAAGALAILAVIVVGCGGLVRRGRDQDGGIDAVRANRRAAINEFATLWPALSTAASGAVSAGGQYNQCDDFGKTHGYFIDGIVVSEDVKQPTARATRTKDALVAAGWEQVRTLDSQELLRARKGDMLLVLSILTDRFLVSLHSACAPVSSSESIKLVDETIAGKDALDIPGIPNSPVPLPSSSHT